MSTNLAAMFERPADAQEARRELLASGFDEDEIELIGAGAPRGKQTDIPDYFSSLLDVDRQHQYVQCFTEGVQRGAAIVSVRDADESLAPRAREILDRHHPVDLDTCRAAWAQQSRGAAGASTGVRGKGDSRADSRQAAARPAQAASTGRAAGAAAATGAAGKRRGKDAAPGEAHIPVVEEQLQVGKREVETGGMRIVARVRSQPVEESVRLREQHAHIERRPVDRPATEADLQAMKDGTIEIRETAEQPVVQKTARVKEELVVGTEQTERTERIREEVRRTEVDVQKLGGAGATGGTPMSAYEADFRQHSQRSFAGRNWTETAPVYEYGYRMGGDQRYASRDWNAAEPDLRRDWESRNSPGTWERAKEAVRYAWERARTRH